MKHMMNAVVRLCLLTLAGVAVLAEYCIAQAPPPGEAMQSISHQSSVPLEYKGSQNVSILDRIETNTWCNGFEAIRIDSLSILITKTSLAPKVYGIVFWDVSNPSTPVELGAIRLLFMHKLHDLEAIQYTDSARVFLYADNDTGDVDVIYDICVTDFMLGQLGPQPLDSTDYVDISLSMHDLSSSNTYVEMLYHHDGMLFLATNESTLRYYDVSSPGTWIPQPVIAFNAAPAVTDHPDVKIHEVKAFTDDNGNKIVGLGTVRSGMRLLVFDESWNLVDSLQQYYDHDRAMLPGTILNPYKMLFDSTVHYPLTDDRNNKWDYRICHSVLPYDSEGKRYVLTVDEFTKSNSGQYQNGDWIPQLWEGLDLFRPNKVDTATAAPFPIYYNGNPVLYENGEHVTPTGWSGFTEVDTLRLNFNHRNHPKHPGVDPLRLQGAFLRIWDRDSIGLNDLGANERHMLLNAYDVQESDSHPEGYVGLQNIPEVSDVPTGLHEPYLVGNTLYLAGYNSGPRILKLNGHDIAVRAYCRTESFLSNDTGSVHFYNRPDIIMYAKGIYRLVPDTNRPGIVYGSDLYNGMWIFRYYDSTLTDTLRHIPFQESIRIGTVEAGKPLHFTIGPGGAVIDDSAKVEFVDNTSFSWATADSLVVRGELSIGAVSFDTSQYAVPRNTLYCAPGGVVYLGGMEKVISGRLNVHVAEGGRLIVKNGTILQLLDSSHFLVEGDLTLESCTVSDGCRFIARDSGRITFDTAAEVSGLKHMLIADGVSRLKFSDSSVVRMQREGSIVCYGIVETPVSGAGGSSWARIQSMYYATNQRCQPADAWYGLLLHGNWRGSQLRNMFIHHGDPGVWIYSGNPTVEDCEISYNDVGCRITEGRPVFRRNHINNNQYIGLDVQNHTATAIESNRISRNDYIGLRTYACNETWYDNRIDSNRIGAEVTEYSKIYFNKWNGIFAPSMCDTSRGNGFRFNWSNGVIVREYNTAEFHCDNSVYKTSLLGPGLVDLGVGPYARVIGWGNYPDSIPGVSADTLSFSVSNHGIFQWDDPTDSIPTPGSDPVLLKTQGPNLFRAALDRAERFTRSGLYSAAQSDYALAVTEAVSIPEFLQGILAWQEMVAMTVTDTIGAQPGNRGPFWTVFHNTLESMAMYSDSAWKRWIATDVLSIEQIRNRDTVAAEQTMNNAMLRSASAAHTRGMLLRLVYMHACVRMDHSRAHDFYNTLNGAYPGSRENTYAKILLRIPPDSTDWAAFAKNSGYTDEQFDVGGGASPQWLSVEGPWPEPVSGTAHLRVRVEHDCVVDISLYDISGKRRRVQSGRSLQSGWNTLLLDCTQLASGSYIVVFQQQERRHSLLLRVLHDK
jgi:hypothetical protein